MKYLFLLLSFTAHAETPKFETQVLKELKLMREYIQNQKADQRAVKQNNECINRCESLYPWDYQDGGSEETGKLRGQCYKDCQRNFPIPSSIPDSGC
jgi:hypothetical protein